ncbi:protein-L-isoaspartate O-methyltransferase [Acidiphilium sp. PA]|uniref:protein-L-isoaspartate O-methyltransferase family protein n=1 Tax=Acidiphilium sp. PA TaxID=2871705 RepID=UPI00224443F6|nr:protein-L-isoaspartate O-methyltransferase [Acidiphilium sp. PA]MCW8307284.1 protein-L-isoaspartate O-methyltransferase [Acidiphilium sp. PA]
MKEKDRDFRTARALMVDCQVRPNNIVDDRIVTAMRTLRRERFVPPALVGRAYSDAELPLGEGRTMPSPLTIGRLASFAAVRPGERVLVIGANTGYGAAVLAACGGAVVALESRADLRAIATAALATEAPEVRVVAGRLSDGAPQHAAFDVIVIEGAIDALPVGLASQLTPKGRVIAIVRQRGVGRIVRAEVSGRDFVQIVLADCQAGALPGFSPEPAFAF